MEFLKSIGRAVGEAAGYLGEKNRRAAQLNRIRAVIRCQEKAAEKEYLALGRYYYHSLRDKENPVTEGHCASLDQIERALDSALDQLEKFYGSQEKAREEVTLEDVQVFDEAPTAPAEAPAPGETASPAQQPAPSTDAGAPAEGPAPQQASQAPAEEGTDLPFEG